MTGFNAILAQYGVALVFVATLLSRLGAPIPAAPLVVIAGGLSASGALSLPLMVACATLASLIGDGAWFLGGRRYGYRILRMLCRISLSPDSCVRQSESLIGRWGGSSLIAAKFLPGLSVVAAPMAGALGMSGRVFIGFELLASALWALGFAYLGVAFSNDIARVLQALSNLGVGAAVLLALIVATYLALRYARRRVALRDLGIARITVAELAELIRKGEDPLVVDVRAPGVLELDPRRIPGAVPVELGRIPGWARELPRDRRIVLYCNCPNEASAAHASRLLLGHGFARAQPLAGGLDAWVTAGHGVETS